MNELIDKVKSVWQQLGQQTLALQRTAATGPSKAATHRELMHTLGVAGIGGASGAAIEAALGGSPIIGGLTGAAGSAAGAIASQLLAHYRERMAKEKKHELPDPGPSPADMPFPSPVSASTLQSLMSIVKGAAELPAPPDPKPYIDITNSEGWAGRYDPDASAGPGIISKGLRTLFEAFGPAGAAAYKQLPSIRIPDTVAGAVLGAGTGALVGKITKKKGWKPTLAGAAIGAGLGNVVGDRFRRYASNKVVPNSYDDPTEAIKPRSFGDFVDAAIKDKPSYNPKDLAKLPLNSRDALDAHRELFRRQLGVHTDEPVSDIFARNPDGSLSISRSNPRAGELIDNLVLGGPDAESLHTGEPEAFRRYAASFNHGWEFPPKALLGSVMGGQSVMESPLDRDSSLFHIKDRWDQTLEQPDKDFIGHAAGRLLRGDIGFLSDKFDRRAHLIGYAPRAVSNAAVLKSLGSRWLLDKVLAKENPWVTQNILVDKPSNSVQVLTGAGERYGK